MFSLPSSVWLILNFSNNEERKPKCRQGNKAKCRSCWTRFKDLWENFAILCCLNIFIVSFLFQTNFPSKIQAGLELATMPSLVWTIFLIKVKSKTRYNWRVHSEMDITVFKEGKSGKNKGYFCFLLWANTYSADSDFLEKPASSRLDLKCFSSLCLGKHTAIPNNMPVVKSIKQTNNNEKPTLSRMLEM